MRKSKHGKEPAAKSGGGYYPTQWSPWEWKEENQSEGRYRLKAKDEYEFEWRQPQDVPRTPLPLEPEVNQQQEFVGAESGSYGSNYGDNYTTAHAGSSSSPIVEEITRGMAQMNTGPFHIGPRPKPTKFEKFDKHYRIHNGHEFEWGRVLKVLWPEPYGDGGQGSTHLTESVREGKHGEKHYEKPRRFLIINPMRGHCVCLPINTYTNRGVMKNGVHAEDHAIIYSTKEPTYLKGEKAKGLTRDPVRFVPNNPQHKLAVPSRLNYAKLYTVEYNVKVWFIGKIHRDSEHVVSSGYNDVHRPLTRGLNDIPVLPSDTFAHAQGGSGESSQLPFNPNFTSSDLGGISSQNYPSESSAPQVYYAPNNSDPIWEETAGAGGAGVLPSNPPDTEHSGDQHQQPGGSSSTDGQGNNP